MNVKLVLTTGFIAQRAAFFYPCGEKCGLNQRPAGHQASSATYRNEIVARFKAPIWDVCGLPKMSKWIDARSYFWYCSGRG